MEFSETIVKVGYSEHAKPQHIIPISLGENKNLSESQFYNLVSPILQKVFDRLMCNPTTRRVVLVLPPFSPSALEAAIKQMLWNKGVPAIALWSTLDIMPVAQGWKRGLIVNVSLNEAVCVCHADGHVLPFTYQSVPCGYSKILPDISKIQTEWTDEMDKVVLNENNPNSLVVALLKSLEECPRDIRPFVVANTVFCGEGMILLPDLGRRVVRHIKQVLEGEDSSMGLSESSTEEQLTMIPIKTKTLAPLASKINLISCAPYRPDWISWVASSLWAVIWNKYDDDESRIQWTFNPASE
jgi:hypothetical protein